MTPTPQQQRRRRPPPTIPTTPTQRQDNRWTLSSDAVKQKQQRRWIGFVAFSILLCVAGILLQPPRTHDSATLVGKGRTRRWKQMSLMELTDTTKNREKCSDGLIHVDNVVRGAASFRKGKKTQPQQQQEAKQQRQGHVIPPLMHQSSKSRCVTPNIASFVQQWQDLEVLDYYFHTDEAVERLLQRTPHPEFPHLASILSQCAVSPTTRGDVWRYLLLWEYGGIYADLDSLPQAPLIQAVLQGSVQQQDAYFVMEVGGLPSQYFMAASPRHPLMYYAIVEALRHILDQGYLAADVGEINAAYVTGPHGALLAAVRQFLWDARPLTQLKPFSTLPLNFSEGLYFGTHNRSFSLQGERGDASNDWVLREAYNMANKTQDYQRMNMTYYKVTMRKTRKGRNCLEALWQAAQQETNWNLPS